MYRGRDCLLVLSQLLVRDAHNYGEERGRQVGEHRGYDRNLSRNLARLITSIDALEIATIVLFVPVPLQSPQSIQTRPLARFKDHSY